MDELVAILARVALDVLPVSALGWLGFRLLAGSIGEAGAPVKLGGPYAFLVLWGLAIFISFRTAGRGSSIVSTLYISLFVLGLVVCFVRMLVRAFTRSSKGL
jgi:hypothetical protein